MMIQLGALRKAIDKDLELGMSCLVLSPSVNLLQLLPHSLCRWPDGITTGGPGWFHGKRARRF